MANLAMENIDPRLSVFEMPTLELAIQNSWYQEYCAWTRTTDSICSQRRAKALLGFEK